MPLYDVPEGYRRAIPGVDKRLPETLVVDEDGVWAPLGPKADGSDLLFGLDYAVMSESNGKSKERMRQLRNERRRQGLCPYCGEPTIPGKSLCTKHYLSQQQAQSSYYDTKIRVTPRPELFTLLGTEWFLTFSMDCPTVWTIAEEQSADASV